MSDLMAKPPLAQWRVSGVRVTAFPETDATLGNRNLWDELDVGEAESHEKKKGQTIIQGAAYDKWLMITISVGRVDWLFLPKPDELEEGEFGFRDVGSFPEAVDNFIKKFDEWVEKKTCPKLVRLAFGATLRLPVADRKSGYEQLGAFLPFKLDGENSSDFFYQINRRRKSAMDSDLGVNRLTKWSVVLLTGIGGQITFGRDGPAPTLRQYGSQSACQVEIDINSEPNYEKGFSGSQIKKFLDEFVNFGKEIAEKGDVP
jgi:hypothetical protein